MITDKLVMPYYDHEENPAKKVFHDLCDKYMRNQLCYPCKECTKESTLVDEHNTKMIKHYDILDVKQRAATYVNESSAPYKSVI